VAAPASVVGVDIAKATFDLCLLQGERCRRRQLPNTPAGWQELLEWLPQAAGPGPVLLALEATGPYGAGLARAVHAAGHQVVVFNPRRVVEFARSCGRRNKTDRVDAELIARFVLSQPPHKRPAWQPLPPAQEALQALLRRQSQLEEQLHGEARRLEVSAPAVAPSLRRALRWLGAELARVEKDVQAHLAAQAGLQADVDRLQAIPGVGEKTARLLTAEVPRHFRHARAVAAWLGVVPRQVQSGTSVRQGAHVGHEAPALRSALYFPALTALRHDPRSRAFAERLRAAGKPPKSIILAVLHKLIRTAFALLKTGADYQPAHRLALA
jgi:transposase